MEKIFYLCDGERENCKKRNCYKNGGDCRHTTDISHAMNFERRGKCKNGSFYEKEDVSRNETSSMRRYCDTDDVGAFGKEQPSDD